MKTKKRGLSSRAGQKGRWLRNFVKSIWTEGKALYSLGIKKHRPIHEQAMRRFLDPSKRGSKFEYKPPRPLSKPITPVVPQPLRKPEAPEVPRPVTPYPTREVGLTSLLHIPPPSLLSVLKKLSKVLTRNFFLITADLNGRGGCDTIDDTNRRQPYQNSESSSLIYFSSLLHES